nr:translation initiation factor IF-2-like [Equus asinus]
MTPRGGSGRGGTGTRTGCGGPGAWLWRVLGEAGRALGSRQHPWAPGGSSAPLLPGPGGVSAGRRGPPARPVSGLGRLQARSLLWPEPTQRSASALRPGPPARPSARVAAPPRLWFRVRREGFVRPSVIGRTWGGGSPARGQGGGGLGGGPWAAGSGRRGLCWCRSSPAGLSVGAQERSEDTSSVPDSADWKCEIIVSAGPHSIWSF